jgi:hypothetical protein
VARVKYQGIFELTFCANIDEMSQRGNYIGMIQQCKRFLETVYSAGTITERKDYQSGTGAKGNGLLERKLLCEVNHLSLVIVCH